MSKHKKPIKSIDEKQVKNTNAPMVIIIILCVLAIFVVAAVVYNIVPKPAPTVPQATPAPTIAPTATAEVTAPAQTAAAEESKEQSRIQIEMEDGGKILLELYPQFAPKTVANFKSLVSSGFYDGLIFHRVISGFMIQGGDPQGTGMGGSDKEITGEFSSNGFKQNTLKHTRGVISMARAENPNSASSQFFIMHQDNASLDGQYAAFGKVLEGMDVVDKIAAVKTDSSDKPLTPVKMKKVKIVE